MSIKNFPKGGRVRFADNFVLDVHRNAEMTDQQIAMGSKSLGQSLKVRTKATHSLKPINNRIYLPHKMKDGVYTFLTPYAKPVLPDHYSDEVLGRMTSAAYTDLVTGSSDGIGGLLATGLGSFERVRRLLEGSMDKDELVAAIQDLWTTGVLQAEDYEGAGYVDLVFRVVDEDAVQKFLDERYLTGSVGASSNAIICSVCGSNWVEDDLCEHDPGVVYDGIKCLMITGDLFYDHYAITPSPADKFSQVVELLRDGSTTHVNFDVMGDSEAHRTAIYLDSTSEEEGTMKELLEKLTKRFSDQLDEAGLAWLQDALAKASEAEGFDASEYDLEALEALKDLLAEKSGIEFPVAEEQVVKDENPTADGDGEAAPVEGDSEDTPAEGDGAEEEQAFIDSLEGAEKLTKAQVEKLYDLMMKDKEDRKLESKELKKLPASDFCGPHRTFPAHDKDHLEASQAFLDRYKGPGDKNKIAASLERKAKRLGCKAAKKEDKQEFDPAAVISEDKYAPEQLDVLFDHLKALVGRDEDEVTPLLGEIEELEVLVGELRDELDKTEGKYLDAHKEVLLIQDRLIEERATARAVKDKLYSVLVLVDSGKKIETEEVGKLSTDLIDAEIKKLGEAVDINKLHDKLNSGMARIPSGERVDNPAEGVMNDSLNQGADDTREVPTKAILDEIHTTAMQLRFSRGEQAMNDYLRVINAKYKLPESDN